MLAATLSRRGWPSFSHVARHLTVQPAHLLILRVQPVPLPTAQTWACTCWGHGVWFQRDVFGAGLGALAGGIAFGSSVTYCGGPGKKKGKKQDKEDKESDRNRSRQDISNQKTPILKKPAAALVAKSDEKSAASTGFTKVIVPADLEPDISLGDMRPALKKLDVKVPHSLKFEKGSIVKWKSVPLPVMREIYSQRRIHMTGFNKSVDWHQTCGLGKDTAREFCTFVCVCVRGCTYIRTYVCTCVSVHDGMHV